MRVEVRKTDRREIYGGEEYFVCRDELIKSFEKDETAATLDYYESVNYLIEERMGFEIPVDPYVVQKLVQTLHAYPKIEGVFVYLSEVEGGFTPRYELREKGVNPTSDEYIKQLLDNLKWI